MVMIDSVGTLRLGGGCKEEAVRIVSDDKMLSDKVTMPSVTCISHGFVCPQYLHHIHCECPQVPYSHLTTHVHVYFLVWILHVYVFPAHL